MKTTSIAFRLVLLSVVIAAAVALSGCAFSVHDRSVPSERTATVGEELIDLKRAYESGAINSSEYEAKKSELLNRQR